MMLHQHHRQDKDGVNVEDDYDSSHQVSCSPRLRYSHNRCHYHSHTTIRLTVTIILIVFIFITSQCTTMTYAATNVMEHNQMNHTSVISAVTSNEPASLLRGTTRQSNDNTNIINNNNNDDDDTDDNHEYILDYHDIDIKNNRKLVTILNRNQILQFQRKRNIMNTTWIIVMNNNNNNNNNNPSNIILSLLRKKIISRLSLTLNAIVVKGITRNTLNWLLQQPDVLLIEENQPVYSLATTVPIRPPTITSNLKDGQPWGIDIVDGTFDRKYTYTYSGIGVNVYIFDTGIMSSHDEFTQISVTCGINVVVNETCDDLKGHGTHIAGTVGGKTYGLAKKVNIINVKVLDKNGNGNVDKVITGLEYVLEQKLLYPNTPMIIGLSLGSNYSTSFNDAVNRCVDAGIIVVVAAGNESIDACTTSPSSADKGIAVGAMDVAFVRPSWSNYGPCVNIFAPAVAILSATYDARDKKKTLYRSGTSMAVPHVIGVIAMYLEWNPSLTPSEVYGFLVNDSVTGLLSNLGIDDDNVLISSTKIQQYEPLYVTVPTTAPTLAPSSVSLETPSCGAILTPCITDDDCCFECLNINLFNLNLFGKRCFLFGN